MAGIQSVTIMACTAPMLTITGMEVIRLGLCLTLATSGTQVSARHTGLIALLLSNVLTMTAQTHCYAVNPVVDARRLAATGSKKFQAHDRAFSLAKVAMAQSPS